MSQSLLYHAFGVREGYDYVETRYEDGCVRFVLSVRPDWVKCPACGSQEINRKGRRFRELQTVPIGLKPVFLVTEVPKCQCAACGKRFEVSPSFAPSYAHYTCRLQRFVNDLRGRMTLSDLAAITGLSWDTVKHIVKQALEKDYGHPRLKELRYLSIDEIYLGREQKYYTLVIDLESGRIVWVAKGKGVEALRKFWRALRLSKARIAAVTMDMSAAYWAAARENLPDAAVVFDRFHIVKLVNEKLDDLRRQMVREATGLMKQTVKGIRYLLLMRRENVGPDKLPLLEEALKTNEPLNLGYLLKEGLGLLWEQRSPEAMAGFLKEWCQWAVDTGIRQMQQLAKTLTLHAQGILNWWEHRISNGRMEGINNKIKTLLRQTYGLRDERYFTLKLYSLHDSRLALLG